MPIAAPITRDLTIDGFGLAAVGVIGLVASIIVVGGNATRVIVPWIIVLLVLGVNLLGNGLRETLDPRRADRR